LNCGVGQPHLRQSQLHCKGNGVDYEWLKTVIGVVAQHGPWALLAWYLVHKLLSTTKREHDLIEAYRVVVVENSRITERLAVLIEERTRRMTNNGK
jgi:hypothetical protein